MNISYESASLYLYMYHKIQRTFPDQIHQFMASVSPDQVRSKEWLCREIFNNIGDQRPQRVHVVGSWFGVPLLDMLYKSINIKSVMLFDIDPVACNIARIAAKKWKFKNCTIDEFNYWGAIASRRADEGEPTLVINTSCEHMNETFDDGFRTLPSRPMIALQSNNKRHIAGHMNCVNSHDELAEQNGIKDAYYKGTMDLDEGYERYMVIGRR